MITVSYLPWDIGAQWWVGPARVDKAHIITSAPTADPHNKVVEKSRPNMACSARLHSINYIEKYVAVSFAMFELIDCFFIQ